MPKRDPDSTLPLSMHDVLFVERERLQKLNDKLCNLDDPGWIQDQILLTREKRDAQEEVVTVLLRACRELGLVDEFGNKIDSRNGQMTITFPRDEDEGEQLEFGAEEQPGPAAADESEMAVERRSSRPRRVRDAEVA